MCVGPLPGWVLASPGLQSSGGWLCRGLSCCVHWISPSSPPPPHLALVGHVSLPFLVLCNAHSCWLRITATWLGLDLSSGLLPRSPGSTDVLGTRGLYCRTACRSSSGFQTASCLGEASLGLLAGFLSHKVQLECEGGKPHSSDLNFLFCV